MKFWNAEKIYGFVREQTEQTEHFLHISQLPDGIEELRMGQKIKFELRVDAKKGREMACDVELIDE